VPGRESFDHKFPFTLFQLQENQQKQYYRTSGGIADSIAQKSFRSQAQLGCQLPVFDLQKE
jgi:hypothetical protein